MSSHFENLNRAARLLRRIADVGEVSEFEGVSMVEIVGDVLMAANAVHVREEVDALLAFRCSPDESAGMAEVVELQNYSRKAPCV